ncbi:hypothetical protein DV532_29315 (plasmid) [Pseudomonas sp. Leaf58]|nr:hypothetical protein DV532_29315 [Pseudomonas sp. Leaf58]KQN62108.1 hypothetical protein ASF02_07975 [Pseudomonas sp. Leaf58]
MPGQCLFTQFELLRRHEAAPEQVEVTPAIATNQTDSEFRIQPSGLSRGDFDQAGEQSRENLFLAHPAEFLVSNHAPVSLEQG